MSDIPTPRTDYKILTGWGRKEEAIAPSFARQLERELTAAREELAKANATLNLYRDKLTWSKEQRDRLAEALKYCREDSVCEQDRMEKCGYQEAAKESQANIDRANEALQSLTTNA